MCRLTCLVVKIGCSFQAYVDHNIVYNIITGECVQVDLPGGEAFTLGAYFRLP